LNLLTVIDCLIDCKSAVLRVLRF